MDKIKNEININLVINFLKKNKIKHIVISPGGTNIPFVKEVQKDDFFSCYSIVDERSAIYFAIGLYLQTGEIIATSCTSAQATRNYIPGLTEAYYKRVPILAITMEKHPRFIFQEYMQAPCQTSLPVDCVKKSFELPYISDTNDILHSMRLINEAILELTSCRKGPVQLCIPWLDFPLSVENVKLKTINRYSNKKDWKKISLENKKILVIIGEHRPFLEDEIICIEKFCESWNVVVYTNHLSNYHGKYCINGNLILSTIEYRTFELEYSPDIIISIGGQTGDYPLYGMLSKQSLKDVEHWRVAEDGEIIDTYDKLTDVFQCSDKDFFSELITNRDSEHTYFLKWLQKYNALNFEVELPFSNVFLAQKMHNMIPKSSIINFAILNSLRVWSLFELDQSINCYSNVGAFGIDGGMSTLIGQSVESDQLCFMIIGDLSFYYDMNSLAIRHIKNNVRILLVNNNGGVEFKLSHQNNSLVDRYIAAGNHFHNAKGWAETCGFKYISANNKEEFNENVYKFLDVSECSIVFEVFVSDLDEAVAYQDFIYANSEMTGKVKMKNNIKKTLRKIIN